jgi:hypothetical protein
MTMTVTAAAVSKNFGAYQGAAVLDPVIIITKNGRAYRADGLRGFCPVVEARPLRRTAASTCRLHRAANGMRPALLQPLDDLEQMADGADQAIETNDDEHVAGDVAHQLRQHRPGSRGLCAHSVAFLGVSAGVCTNMKGARKGTFVNVS